jgi:acetyl-CoA carboxylase biotin carboxyl carrier protein
MKIDRDAIRELAEILNDTGLTEIEIEEKDLKVRVSRKIEQVTMSAPVMQAAAPAAVAAPAAAPVAVVADASHPGALKSPMVGTAYHSPEPDAANFVNVGDKVSEGDTVMIIEAMKVMNPIKATKSGTVTQILADDASPVEFGDVLAIIE